MALLRSAVEDSKIIRKRLAENMLPTNRDVVGHYFYVRQLLIDTDPNFEKVTPGYKDVKDVVVTDVRKLWKKASLPVIEPKSTQNKLKQLIDQFHAAKKRAKTAKRAVATVEDWLEKLFDISKCRCDIVDDFPVSSGKLLCKCHFDHRIPEKEVLFLKDQRFARKMILTSSKDTQFNKKKQQALDKLKRRDTSEKDTEVASTSSCDGFRSRNQLDGVVLHSRLRPRKRKANFKKGDEEMEQEETNAMPSGMHDDSDYQPPEKQVISGKAYTKRRSFWISPNDCVTADRRFTSIRQQSDLQRSTVGAKNISASPATVLRKREQCRLEALERCDKKLNDAKAIQLCYDGKILNRMDRYIFLGQFEDETSKLEKVIAVKTFPEGASVNSESIFNSITEEISDNLLKKIYSVMSDTTALNTGKKSGINKRLVDFYKDKFNRGVHALECLFHVNEIYLSHIISKIEGKKKGPNAMEEGSLMKYFNEIRKPELNQIIDRKKLTVPVTSMAALHLRKKIEWFSNEKDKRRGDNSLRSDHMCMLVLSAYLIIDVPENLKNLLTYKQEATCHARWVTTANAYLRLLIFNICDLGEVQRARLTRLVSYIVCVYVPSFLLIHLKPSAAEGPGITLFQRDLLLAFREIDPELADIALKYYHEHAIQWLTPINIALSAFAEVPPYSLEAIRTGHFPQSVDSRKLLQDRKAGLKSFFTAESKNAPCVMCTEVPSAFWKVAENNNRATERLIGKLKLVLQSSIVDCPSQLGKTDVRVRAFLCNIK